MRKSASKCHRFKASEYQSKNFDSMTLWHFDANLMGGIYDH